MEKKIYEKPFVETILTEKVPLMESSFGGDAGEAIGGGTLGGDAKSFFSWTFQEREGIMSDKLSSSWE